MHQSTDMYIEMSFCDYISRLIWNRNRNRNKFISTNQGPRRAYTINNYDWYITTIHQTKYSQWSINNCGTGTLGQEKRYMHIHVHTHDDKWTAKTSRVDWCNQKTTFLYTYQSTDAIRKRHIIAVLHISKPWKWKKKEKKWKKGDAVSCPQVPVININMNPK